MIVGIMSIAFVIILAYVYFTGNAKISKLQTKLMLEETDNYNLRQKLSNISASVKAMKMER